MRSGDDNLINDLSVTADSCFSRFGIDETNICELLMLFFYV